MTDLECLQQILTNANFSKHSNELFLNDNHWCERFGANEHKVVVGQAAKFYFDGYGNIIDIYPVRMGGTV
jgi:hypothetical protein